MKKLILFSAALLIAGQASAYAQGEHTTRHHKHFMSSHAQMRYEGGSYDRAPEFYAAPVYAPSYNSPSYYNSDQEAEGRTSGG
jgi:hypothetical protein